MSGGAAVQCLPCGKKLVIREMSSHIHEHIHYYPHICNNCDFRCVNKNDLDLHTFETDHTGSICFDPYKQWLVDTINDDCRFAAKYGVDELLKRKNITTLPRTPTQPSPIVTPAQQPRPTPTVRRVVSPPPQLVETSSDSDDEPQQVAARPKAPAVPVKRNSGVQNRRPEPPAKEKSETDDSEDSDDEEIVKLRQELTKNVKCRLCSETVRISLNARQSHVKENHMDGLTNGQQSEARKRYFQNELEKRTKDAFPNLVWTSLQCPKCPKIREIKSASGRISHVYNAHHTYLKKLGCPKAPCTFTSLDPHEFKKHFMESHGSGPNWKLFLGNTRLEREFPSDYAEHRRKIESISRLLFPMDIPQHILEATKNKRKSRGDVDDDDILDISALIAAAPTKPTVPRTAEKRRRSPSVVSSDEDSDDDKPSGNKKTAAAAPKPRASDKEEETEREEDQDSSHNSSSATVAGDTVNSKKNGEREVKREEDIKQEPPATPTVPSGRTFPGRSAPLSTSLTPGEQARQQHLRNIRWRGGHEGTRSVGYGEGRGAGRGSVSRGRAGFNNTPSGGGYGRGRRLY
ncbi:hypothetical protein PRIPAC_75413 [Pristionchus pacificus]|uniref:Uncharacterized protein n=1 Tax=Pristionchus pacificus TaxID=54126 RepID=A0A2A6BEQ6_PRIPA|nr:hypothetical protein PRIPAC_75413 [Pristionchus pacificus]|eukprot:PDM64343.1 hypothetical protein PRIPAC_52599 [Pristionchus pacificus]